MCIDASPWAYFHGLVHQCMKGSPDAECVHSLSKPIGCELPKLCKNSQYTKKVAESYVRLSNFDILRSNIILREIVTYYQIHCNFTIPICTGITLKLIRNDVSAPNLHTHMSINPNISPPLHVETSTLIKKIY